MYLPVLMNMFWSADWLFIQTVLKKKKNLLLILITSLLDIVLILYGEILYWSPMGEKRLIIRENSSMNVKCTY